MQSPNHVIILLRKSIPIPYNVPIWWQRLQGKEGIQIKGLYFLNNSDSHTGSFYVDESWWSDLLNCLSSHREIVQPVSSFLERISPSYRIRINRTTLVPHSNSIHWVTHFSVLGRRCSTSHSIPLSIYLVLSVLVRNKQGESQGDREDDALIVL